MVNVGKLAPFILLFLIFASFATLIVMGQNNSPATTNVQPTPTVVEITTPPATPSAQPREQPNTSTPTPTPAPATKATKAIIKTSKGNIEVTLFPDVAPQTVANFAKKGKEGFYSGLTFHRVEDWVVQGGDPEGTGAGGDEMPTELNDKPFMVGSLGVARKNDIKVSNDAQFFITKKDSQFLNSQYTNFGQVTKGMDVVNNIAIGDKILGITTE